MNILRNDRPATPAEVHEYYAKRGVTVSISRRGEVTILDDKTWIDGPTVSDFRLDRFGNPYCVNG